MDESEMRVILSSGLFQGIGPEEAEALFPRLRPRRAVFEKDACIIGARDGARSVGLLLSGIAHVIKEDFWGGRTILSGLLPGDLFAETRALLPDSPLKVSVMAAAPATAALFLDLEYLTGEAAWEEVRTRLARNLMAILARKNLVLSRQAELLSGRTIRERLLSYLTTESFHRGSTTFEIPFTRQELADHLAVNRCCLSSEITKLKEEGILKCRGRKFMMLPQKSA